MEYNVQRYPILLDTCPTFFDCGVFFVILSHPFTTIDWQPALFIWAFYGRHVYTEGGSAWYTRHGPFNDTFGSSLGHPYDSFAAASTTHRRIACWSGLAPGWTSSSPGRQ